MSEKFLDFHGLSTVFEQLKLLFATKKAVKDCKDLTDPFILDVDYSKLEFNLNQIVDFNISH